MKLYTYWKDGAEHIGVGCDEDSLYPVEAFGLSFAGMTDLIRRITMEEKKRLADPKNAVGAPLPLEGLKLCAPIPHPAQDVICLGINYHAHAAESARFNAKAFWRRAAEGHLFFQACRGRDRGRRPDPCV